MKKMLCHLGLQFNPQQSHGGSQLFVMRSDAFFWYVGVHAGRTL